jgi:hypothetical protein
MNWGNRLLVTFILFGAGILYMVFRTFSVNSDLVKKDYYKDELRYQQVIDGSNRANALTSPVKLELKYQSVLLQLPEEMTNKEITGEVLFYCAYNEKKDKQFPLQVDNKGIQIFQPGTIAPGNYTVKITWKNDGKDYYAEQSLTVL